MAATESTHKLTWIVGSVLLIAFGTYGYLLFLPWNFDDGMIVARIVRNILNGQGWVYNIGEYVNASTSVLNTILITTVSFFTGDILRASHLVGALAITASSFSIWRILSPHYGDTAGLATGAILSYSLSHNATWGLEIHLFIALLLYFILREQQGKDTWALLGFLILARPDAMLIAVFKILRARVEREAIIAGLLKLSLPLAPWIVFSLYTFGQVFPSTLSNKIWQGRSGMWGHGAIYLKALIKHLIAFSIPMYAMLLLAPLGAYIVWARRSPLLYLIGFCSAQQIAYCFLNVPGYHWYFSVLTSTILILGLLASFRLATVSLPRVVALCSKPGMTLLFSVGGLALPIQGIFNEAPRTDVRDIKYSTATKEFEDANVGDGDLGTLEVGSIGYHSQRHILDLTGLTSKNPEFITGKNTDRFFERRPRFLLLHSPLWHFERSIIDDLRFDLLYELVPGIPNPEHGLSLFKLKEDQTSFDHLSLQDIIREKFPAALKVQFDSHTRCEGACLCIIDYLNGQFSSTKEIHTKQTIIRARGWAVENDSLDSLSTPELLLRNGSDAYSISGLRESRPDVATHLKRPEFANAGFTIEGNILDVPQGRYEVYIGQKRGETLRYCETPLTLVIE